MQKFVIKTFQAQPNLVPLIPLIASFEIVITIKRVKLLSDKRKTQEQTYLVTQTLNWNRSKVQDKNVIFCCPLITSFRARKVLDIKKKEKNYFDAFIYISSEKMITMCAFQTALKNSGNKYADKIGHCLMVPTLAGQGSNPRFN